MHNIFAEIKKYLRYFLAPPFCVSCKVLLFEPTIFCQTCYENIQPVVTTYIKLTPSVSMPVYAISAYQEPVRSLIQAKLWSQALASKQLGQLIWQATVVRHLTFDYIVPIPLHWTRYAWRGYNQAELIAQELARQSGRPLVLMLERNKKTDIQGLLSAQERYDNLKDAIALKKSVQRHTIQGKHILLVDDVMTTGATVTVAAKTLLSCKPASISSVVACRSI